MRVILLNILILIQLAPMLTAGAAELSDAEEKQIYARASLYARQPHQLERACTLFEKLTLARPDNLEYLKMHVQLLLQLAEYEEAARITRSFEMALPDNPASIDRRIEVLVLLSEICQRSGDGVQTSVFRQQARQLADDRPTRLLPLVTSLARLQQEEELLAFISEERKQRRDDYLWLLEAGDSYLRQERWWDAFQELQRGFGRPEISSSRLRHRLLRIPLEEPLLSDVLRWGADHEDSAPVTRAVGEWLVQWQRFQEAVPFYVRLDQLEQSDGKALLRLGETLVKEESWELALTLLQEHEQLHPELRRGWDRTMMIAQAQRELNRPEEAISTLKLLLATTRDRIQLSRLQLAIGDITLDHLGDPTSALEWYRQVDGPGNWLATAYQKQARAYLIMDQLSEAREINRRGLTEFSNDRKISRNLTFQQAGLLFYDGDFATCRLLLDSLTAFDFASHSYNDIIRKRQLLGDGEHDRELSQLSAAELLHLQGRNEAAAAGLLELLRGSDEGNLLLYTARFLTLSPDLYNASEPDTLIAVLDRIAGRLPELVQLAEIMYHRDRLLMRGYQRQLAAVTGWEQFLVNFPHSPRIDEVRAQLRTVTAAGRTGERDINRMEERE